MFLKVCNFLALGMKRAQYRILYMYIIGSSFLKLEGKYSLRECFHPYRIVIQIALKIE